MSTENGVIIFDDFSLVTSAVLNPTSASHALLAQQMIQMFHEPSTYVLLITGLLLIGMQIRCRHSSRVLIESIVPNYEAKVILLRSRAIVQFIYLCRIIFQHLICCESMKAPRFFSSK